MKKFLVEIYLPAANKTFDVYIPSGIRMGEVTMLVAQAAAELAEGSFTPSQDTALCHRQSGTMFNINMTAEEQGIQNGSKLALI